MIIEGIELRDTPLPSVAGTFKGICIVLGSGLSIFEDIKKAQWWIDEVVKLPHHTMAANLSFLAWNGTLEHLVSLHQNKLPHFFELSEDLPVSRVGHKTHAHCPFPTQQEGAHLWDIYDNNGTSSLFALKVAILLGYDRIICCGMDLDGPHRFYDNPNFKTNNNFSCDAIMFSWKYFKEVESFKKKVRAVSGKTMQLFGEPTLNWLRGE